MKWILAAALALPAGAHAGIASFAFEAEVREVVVTDGPTSAGGFLKPGQRLEFTIRYETDTPGTVDGDTATYWLRGEWAMDFGGGQQGSAGFGTITVTDDNPAWDAITFSADPTNVFGGVGVSVLQGATMVLTDSRQTAFSSLALVPVPPFDAFTSGEFELLFIDLFSETMGSTRVRGRIVSIDGTPRAVYRCEGFNAPFDRAITLASGSQRVFPLQARLRDVSDAPVGPVGLLSRPVLRVLREVEGGEIEVTGTIGYVGLGADDAGFVYRDGAWRLNLRGMALPEPGRYAVSMTTPDQDEYVIEPRCEARFRVLPRTHASAR